MYKKNYFKNGTVEIINSKHMINDHFKWYNVSLEDESRSLNNNKLIKCKISHRNCLNSNNNLKKNERLIKYYLDIREILKV